MFDRILVPLDGSEPAEEALPHAVKFARAYRSRLFLLQVLDAGSGLFRHCPEDPEWRLYKVQARSYLASLKDRLAREDIQVEFHVAEGRVASQILDFIREWRIDLVVVCPYGRGGVSEFPFGGTVQKIVASLETSVMVARLAAGTTGAVSQYGRILLPLDGSQRAAWAVSLVAGMADGAAPEVILLQVVHLPDMPRSRPLSRAETDLRGNLVECNRRAAAAYLDEIKNRFDGKLPIRTRLEESANVVDTIERVAEEENVDLIALTAHGASDGVGTTGGTICRSVVQLSSRSVLVFQDSPARYRERQGEPARWMERKICAE